MVELEIVRYGHHETLKKDSVDDALMSAYVHIEECMGVPYEIREDGKVVHDEVQINDLWRQNAEAIFG